jgi:cob(I)alamin adenosyltransferase
MSIKIYTKTGDKGETGYLGGRIAKDSLLIETIGEIDELNAIIGICATFESVIQTRLVRVQGELFSIGAIFADYEDKLKIDYAVGEWVLKLENEIDEIEAKLEPLKNFILPGGTAEAAHLHLARGVCRRVERHIVSFHKNHQVQKTQTSQYYFNRLSDWLFVMARYANQQADRADTLWRS